MAGHSKWANIKHRKAAMDAKRGKLFTKLSREITIAAREGGGNPENNPRLRIAIQNARAANMPNDSIQRAIKRGTGELGGDTIEEVIYEGYAPGGVALMIAVMTDNRNRTVSELRHLLSRHGGSMAEAGSVAWNFQRRGVLYVEKNGMTEEQMLEYVLEADAEDMVEEADFFIVYTEPGKLSQVQQFFEQQQLGIKEAKVEFVPSTTLKVEDPAVARKVLKLLEALEDHDDVQNVYANFEVDDEILEELQAQSQ